VILVNRKLPPNPLSLRLIEIRQIHFGARGRSEFARQLGIPITSYTHYETDRIPPAELLLKAARLTGTRLEWLLEGTGPREDSSRALDQEPIRKIVDELAVLLARSPRLISSAEEFVQLLRRLEVGNSSVSPILPPPRCLDHSDLIPVIGSTAAGLAHFWKEIDVDVGGAAADARIEDVLKAYTARALDNPQKEFVAKNMTDQTRVALVQYSTPDEDGFLEFLSATDLKRRYPQAVAWRIDGDSMSPRYRDGDFVITSSDTPAMESHPCVARQKGQIGVNCKLYQSTDSQILLIPINTECATQIIERDQLQWACRVLASVRLH